MPRRLCLTIVLVLSAFAAAAPGAHAAWFPAEPVDGPAEIESLGGVDLARDGTGAVVYIKKADGADHVFMSRFYGGAWRPAERVDVGVPEAATEARVAVADRYRIAVLWISAGRVIGSVVQGDDEQPGPLLGPTELYRDPSGEISDLSLDMGINGTAYASYSAPGGGGADVRVTRLQGIVWQNVATPLDVDPGQPAGRSTQRTRVAVSAEGNGLVVWGEDHADGRARVYGRRVTGLAPSAVPQELSVADVGGTLGGRADSPDVDIEDDGSFAWAVFRQDFAGGTRTIARRLLGSQFEPPVLLDAGGTTLPRIAMNGRGIGVAALEAGSGVNAAFLENDVFAPAIPLNAVASAQPTAPVVAASEHREVAVAWRVADAAGAGAISARFKPDEKPFEGEVTLSRTDLGPVDAGEYAATSDRLAGMAVAMIQGATGSPRWLTVAVQDRPPGPPGGQTTGTYQRRSRPTFKWAPGLDLWGAQTFRVVVDGRPVGDTTARTLVPATPLASGRPHPWRVIAIDRHGQQTSSKERFIRIDAVAPRVVVKVKGKRKPGQSLKISVTGLDGKGSGIDYVFVEYGDKASAKQFKQFRGAHRYRKGSFRLKVKVVDKAGNAARKTVKLRIK